MSRDSNLIASGSTDTSVKIWRLNLSVNNSLDVDLSQTIVLAPRLFPLALALHAFHESGAHVLAVAGTKSTVQVYTSSDEATFTKQTTLTGHGDWVRSLAITRENPTESGDLLLASASQDKYIRLWRIATANADAVDGHGHHIQEIEACLSNKAHNVSAAGRLYHITFEALLLGHEDWIYTLVWRLNDSKPTLISASADSSLAVWQPDEISGMWLCTTRLGEMSALKGSTTATGGTGGFWSGLASPTGNALVSLGKTGSWRLWTYEETSKRWVQGIGISGHTKSVTDIAWARDGSYLLSTGSDQTTRLHATWERGTEQTWHEMSRPQIHGYDLNCVDSIAQLQFISGADEKLLRVFDAPRVTAETLQSLCNIQIAAQTLLPEAATLPVLGLSNKSIEEQDQNESGVATPNEPLVANAITSANEEVVLPAIPEHPPTEDQLTRHTLWPEREKLYGHGYEISAVAASHGGSIVATSCRASALEHAVIRLYTTNDWREVRPPLAAHALTVTALCFSEDDQYLLSAGRDRQWTIFERDIQQADQYQLNQAMAKAHSRMILDACWAPAQTGRIFATAGRDKSIKLWKLEMTHATCLVTLSLAAPVTAVHIAPFLSANYMTLASGTETGAVSLYSLDILDWTFKHEDDVSQW